MKVNIFKKEYTLNRVRDHVTFKEGNDTISLYVDCDPGTIVYRIQKAQKTLTEIKPESTREDRIRAAREFSSSLFGEEQTQQLFDFYHGDENCVVTICGMYFGDPRNGLGKKITKAQKKNRAVIR